MRWVHQYEDKIQYLCVHFVMCRYWHNTIIYNTPVFKLSSLLHEFLIFNCYHFNITVCEILVLTLILSTGGWEKVNLKCLSDRSLVVWISKMWTKSQQVAGNHNSLKLHCFELYRTCGRTTSYVTLLISQRVLLYIFLQVCMTCQQRYIVY